MGKENRHVFWKIYCERPNRAYLDIYIADLS